MKSCIKYLFSLVLLVSNSMSDIYSQTKVEKMFEQAEVYYSNDQLDSALIIFQEITKKFPKHKLYPKAFYNVGYTAWQMQNYDLTILTFEQILKSDFNDMEKGPGTGIMSEPYAIYKHRSSAILSETYLAKNDYNKALEYL